MQCLTDLGAGQFSLSSPQPTEYTACTYVLVQPSELQPQIFNLSVADGLQLSAAIVAVWAIGFGTRWGIKALNDEKE